MLSFDSIEEGSSNKLKRKHQGIEPLDEHYKDHVPRKQSGRAPLATCNSCSPASRKHPKPNASLYPPSLLTYDLLQSFQQYSEPSDRASEIARWTGAVSSTAAPPRVMDPPSILAEVRHESPTDTSTPFPQAQPASTVTSYTPSRSSSPSKKTQADRKYRSSTLSRARIIIDTKDVPAGVQASIDAIRNAGPSIRRELLSEITSEWYDRSIELVTDSAGEMEWQEALAAVLERLRVRTKGCKELKVTSNQGTVSSVSYRLSTYVDS